MRLEVGTRLYNHGDMANAPKFGEIVEVREPSGFAGRQYRVRWEPEGEEPYVGTLEAYCVSETFKGHSGTRIVTEAKYWRYWADFLAATAGGR